MIGLDNSGKSTILYNLSQRKGINATPTVGFNVETVKYGKSEFNVWDSKKKKI